MSVSVFCRGVVDKRASRNNAIVTDQRAPRTSSIAEIPDEAATQKSAKLLDLEVLQNEKYIAKINFDTAEDEPSEIW